MSRLDPPVPTEVVDLKFPVPEGRLGVGTLTSGCPGPPSTSLHGVPVPGPYLGGTPVPRGLDIHIPTGLRIPRSVNGPFRRPRLNGGVVRTSRPVVRFLLIETLNSR